MQKQITKNQHYVPQHYFKYFSGGDRYIAAHLLKKNKIVPQCSISEQASKRFFYGDQEFEDMVCDVENKIRSALDEAQTNMVNNKKNKCAIIEYLSYQASRTSKRRTQALNAYRSIEALLDLEKNATTPSQAKDWLTKFDMSAMPANEKFWHWQEMQLSTNSSWQMQDLALLIIRAQEKLDFVFSDAPVVFTNPHMKRFSKLGTTGTLSKGLISIFPLNGRHCAILYDENVYRINKEYAQNFQTNKKILAIGDNDVLIINTLQYIFAENCVYSNNANNFILGYEALREASKIKEFECGIDVVQDNASETTFNFHGALDDVQNAPEIPFFDYETSRRYIKARAKALAVYKSKHIERMERVKKLIRAPGAKNMSREELLKHASLSGGSVKKGTF